MLAAVPSPHPPRLPMAGHTHSLSRNIEAPTSAIGEEDRLCAGCKESVNSETGGVVVAFGNSLWHVDCFKCAKCGNVVNADTNLLLLSDDSPVCANCYNCKACNLPILDEAVMTGEDSYHAACFICRTCHKRIDELVFAKTSQGFYCMKCHNERVARARSKSRAAKQQKEKERLGASSSKSPGGNAQGKGAAATSMSRLGSDSSVKTHRTGDTTPPPSASGHSYAHSPYTPHTPHSANSSYFSSTPHQHSNTSTPAPTELDTSFTEIMPNDRFAESMLASLHAPQTSRRAASPAADGMSSINTPTPRSPFDSRAIYTSSTPDRRAASPVVNRSSNGSTASKGDYAGTHFQSSAPASEVPGGVASTSAVISPSIEVAPPPPYSVTPPPDHASSPPGSAQSSQTAFFTAETGRSSPSPLNQSVPSVASEFGEIRRNSHEGDARNPSSSLSPNSSTSHQGGLSVTPLRSKRHSINPGMRLDASRFNTASSGSSASGKSSHSGKPVSAGRDSPHMPSPLRDHFGSVDSHGDERRLSSVSNKTMFYSPSSSPQPPEPSQETSSANVESNKSAPLAVVKPPQRSDSLARGIPEENRNAASTPIKSIIERSVQGPSRQASLGLMVDDRSQPSPRLNGSFLQDSHGSHSRSASPKPPDVPENVGSGTDTEADAESDREQNDAVFKSKAPPPPAKENSPRGMSVATAAGSTSSLSHPRSTSVDSRDDFSPLSDGSEPSSSPRVSISREERRTSVFLTAIPPMRFSMDQTDFSEILRYVNPSDSSNALPSLPESDGGTPSTPESASFLPDLRSDSKTSKKGKVMIERSSTPEISNNVEDVSNSATPKAAKMSSQRSGNDTRDASPTKRRSSRGTSLDSSSNHDRGLSNDRDINHSDADNLFQRPSQGSSNRELSHLKETSSAKTATGTSGLSRLPEDRPSLSRQDTSDIVSRRLRDAVATAEHKGLDIVKLDISFINAILEHTEKKKDQFLEVSGKLDGLKRTSQQMIDGLTVAQEEYDKELAARREAEAEVTRLKVELSNHAARLTLFSGDEKRRELQASLSQRLTDDLNELQKSLPKLKVDRDMVIAEVEELLAAKKNDETISSSTICASLTTRLDQIQKQYQTELVPLSQQREALLREIAELKAARKAFLEETTVLNARNEELNQLNAQLERRLDTLTPTPRERAVTPPNMQRPNQSFDTIRCRTAVALTPTVSTSSSVTLHDEMSDTASLNKLSKPESVESTPAQTRRGIFAWAGTKAKHENGALVPTPQDSQKQKWKMDHVFQQMNILRFTRCDHCGDKMWGSQLRCTSCSISVHPRCASHVRGVCKHDASKKSDEQLQMVGPPPPSMFGRDLVEQVQADSQRGSSKLVPVIVEKCIDAVETLAMDYEGIYRKTGGTGQSKVITQLFERGEYDAFDLRNSDAFNDISSVTSVLKNYFRSLPNPLLTYALHESFVAAADVRDNQKKSSSLGELVSELPKEHYNTLCHLMLHLHRVQLQSDRNLMTARNLGVVFGPTLMRSPDVGREFADMAGKALTIEWLIENAPTVFSNYPLQE